MLKPTPPQAGIDLIKQFEGLKLEAYSCPGGVLSIGFGHTGNVYPGMTVSKKTAEDYLDADVGHTWEMIRRLVTVSLTDNEAGALLSWAYNVGTGAMQKSTLLKLLNQGFYEQIPAQLMRWNKVNGEELGGLSRRRAAEAKLWNEAKGGNS